LVAQINQVYFSYNDSYLIYRSDKNEGFVEIANPYIKEGFAFFKPKIFFRLLSDLNNDVVISSISLLKKGVEDRYDFECSQGDNW